MHPDLNTPPPPRRAKVIRPSKSLLWALVRAFLPAILLPAIPQAAYTAAQLTVPFLVSDTISFAESYAAASASNPGGSSSSVSPQPESHGWGLVGAWGLVYLVIAVSAGQLTWSLGKAEVKLRGALIEVVYEKSLRLSLAAAHGVGGGAVSNLLSVDTERIVSCIRQIHTLWSGFVQIAVGTYLLYLQIGWPFAAALITVLLCIILTPLGSLGIGAKQTRWSAATDARVNLAASILTQIQGIKLMAFEPVLLRKLRAYRQREIAAMRIFFNHTCAIVSWTNVVGDTMLLSILVTMVVVDRMTGSTLVTTNSVFTVMTIISIVQMPIMRIGQEYAEILTALSSIRRIEDFNAQPDAPEPISDATTFDPQLQLQAGEVARLVNASIGWARGKRAVLQNVTLSIPKAKLTMVCGRTATGKSTLLACLLGETVELAGTRTAALSSRLAGGVAYVPQDAWDQQSHSVRANVLFGAPFDAQRYACVLAATALDVDLRHLPHGDAAKAKTLSGGQRQRLGLARALYRYEEADTYIMDDFISALDAETAAHVWASILGDDGLLKGKTVIIASNATHLLARADLVVRLGNGTVEEIGSFEQLSIKGKTIVERASIDSQRPAIALDQSDAAAGASMTGDASQDEEIESLRTAGVQWSIFNAYIHACGLKTFYFGLVIYAAQSFLTTAQLYELQFWTRANDHDYRAANLGAYLSGFVAITLVVAFWMALCIYYTVWYMSPKASVHLHERLLRGLLRAPIAFFAKMPPGSLLSRCSQDIYYLDATLAWVRR
jgi:ATP-binding cassette, subfamily C (CFTR/MRP), member 1